MKRRQEWMKERYHKIQTAYYGSEVREYTCASQGVSKWRIYYVDST